MRLKKFFFLVHIVIPTYPHTASPHNVGFCYVAVKFHMLHVFHKVYMYDETSLLIFRIGSEVVKASVGFYLVPPLLVVRCMYLHVPAGRNMVAFDAATAGKGE